MRSNKFVFASLLVAGMAVSASASAIDITFCDAAGNPYCDGITLTINAGNLTGTAVSTGCYVGTGAGGIAYQIGQGGAGVSLGWSADSSYQGAAASTEVTLSTQTWRHVGYDGSTFNSGTLCFVPAVAGATSSGGSAD